MDTATAHLLSERAELRCEIHDVRDLLGGAGPLHELVCTDGRRFIVKPFEEPSLQWKMETEAFAYGFLADHRSDVPRPSLVFADDSKEVLAHSYLILTKVSGETILSVLEHLSERDLARIYRQVGELLRRLHRFQFARFGDPRINGDPSYLTNSEYMRVEFEQKRREFERLGGDRYLAKAIARYFAAHDDLLFGCTQAVFCHNDFHDGNLLVVHDGDWRISGVVDFENAVAGDPLLDLAKAYCYCARPSEVVLGQLIEGYGPIRTGWRSVLGLYVLYHNLALWVLSADSGAPEELAALPHLIDEMRRICST